MHSYTSAICQFLFIFRCHSGISWQRHNALISRYPSPVSKTQRHGEVMRIIWFMPWIPEAVLSLSLTNTHAHTHAHTHDEHTPSWTLLHLEFYSQLSRRSCARASRTCCFRLPEQMDIRSALCLPGQTNDLPSPSTAFLPPRYIPKTSYLLYCTRDINKSKQSLLAWLAVWVWVLLFLHLQPQWTRADMERRKKTVEREWGSFIMV